jgi:hypothetical protein
MATPINSITCIPLTSMDGLDCVGDSRHVINGNITNLGTAVCTISTTLINSTTAINSSFTTLSTIVSSQSTILNSLSTSFNTNNITPSATFTQYVSTLQLFTPQGNYIGFIPIYI